MFGGSKPPSYAYWKAKIILLLGSHAFGLTPPGVEFYTLATDFYGLIGAYPHIILLLSGQLAHGLRSRLILADRHRLGFLKLAAGTVLHLIAGSLSPLLFPGHLKAFLGSGDFRYAGALGVNIIGHGLTAAVIALEGHFHGVFAHILHALGIADGIIRAVLQGLALAVFHGHRRFLHFAVVGASSFAQLDIAGFIVCLQGLGVCGLAAGTGTSISCRPFAVLRSRGLGQGTAFFFVIMTQRRDNIPVHLICANGAEVGRVARSGAGGQYRIPRLVIMLVTADFKFRLGPGSTPPWYSYPRRRSRTYPRSHRRR